MKAWSVFRIASAPRSALATCSVAVWCFRKQLRLIREQRIYIRTKHAHNWLPASVCVTMQRDALVCSLKYFLPEYYYYKRNVINFGNRCRWYTNSKDFFYSFKAECQIWPTAGARTPENRFTVPGMQLKTYTYG